MTMPIDSWGLPLSTTEAAAVHYREGVERMLGYLPGVEEALEGAIAADPSFALPHSQLALFRFFRGEAQAAGKHAREAERLASSASERECRHTAILGAPITGRGAEAAGWIAEHLEETPRDAPIVLQWLGGNFYNGGVEKRERMLEQFDRLAPAFGEDWWFLSWHAFANHEMDQLDRAEALAARSLALRRSNGQAAHTQSHVFFERRDAPGGANWLGSWLEEYPHRAGFHRHLTWHQALFLLANGRPAEALSLHEDAIRPGADEAGDAMGAVADAASLLWRCRLHDGAASFDWREVAAFAERAFPRAGTVWVDVHRAMALAALGDETGIGALLDGLREAGERGHPIADTVARPVVEALWAFGSGDYAAAAAQLSDVREALVSLGGSNAQRDVFEETLVEARLRAGQTGEALTLLQERLERGATGRDLFRWGRAQSAQGAFDEARASLARARTLWAEADGESEEVRRLEAKLQETLN